MLDSTRSTDETFLPDFLKTNDVYRFQQDMPVSKGLEKNAKK